jgi:hypothetical protein
MPIGSASNRKGRSPPGSRAASAVARESAGTILFAFDLSELRPLPLGKRKPALRDWMRCLKSQPLGNSCLPSQRLG